MKYLSTFAAMLLVSLANGIEYDPNALAKHIVSQQLSTEKKLYDSMPDIIDCDRQASWMDREHCSTINFLIKKHPGAPIRVTAYDGVTHSFDPFTPTPMINAFLDPTGEDNSSGNEIVKYLSSLNKINSKVANSINESVLSHGGTIPNSVGYRQIERKLKGPLDLDLQNLQITVFVSPMDKASPGYLKILAGLITQNPLLNIQIVMVSSHLDWLQNNVIDKGFTKYAIISKEKSKRLGVMSFPMTYILNKEAEKTIITEYTMTLVDLKTKLKSASRLVKEN